MICKPRGQCPSLWAEATKRARGLEPLLRTSDDPYAATPSFLRQLPWPTIRRAILTTLLCIPRRVLSRQVRNGRHCKRERARTRVHLCRKWATISRNGRLLWHHDKKTWRHDKKTWRHEKKTWCHVFFQRTRRPTAVLKIALVLIRLIRALIRIYEPGCTYFSILRFVVLHNYDAMM